MENFSDKFLFVRDRRFVQNPLPSPGYFARRCASLLFWDRKRQLKKIRSSHESETGFVDGLCALALRGLLGKGFGQAGCVHSGNRGGESC